MGRNKCKSHFSVEFRKRLFSSKRKTKFQLQVYISIITLQVTEHYIEASFDKCDFNEKKFFPRKLET